MAAATLSIPRADGAIASDAPSLRALAPGARLGAYELLLPLASGGMGHVWSAVRIGDFGFRRAVAIKVMREELAADPEFRAMFLDEARLASRVSHGNVVEVLDLGEDNGVLYQAMALVDGDALSRLAIASAEIPVAVIARIVADVLSGLHAAHELRGEDGELLGFVHRDVSPQNILVGLDGITKITDFGVAKAAGVSHVVSRSGRKGKLPYMPVEQRDGGPIDRRTDVFATGVVLWELLVGVRRGPDDERIPHPCEVRASAHRPLADVAMRALAIRQEDRFATAEEMADAVEHAAHASGHVLSSRSVAAWVGALASARILQRRHDTDVQLARTLAGTASANDANDAVDAIDAVDARGTGTIDERPVVRPSRRWLYAVGALVALGAVTTGVVRAMSRPASSSSSSSAAQPSIASSASPASPASSVSSASGVSEEASAPEAPVASPPVASVSAVSPTSPRTKPARRPRAAPAAAADLPKYKNPY